MSHDITVIVDYAELGSASYQAQFILKLTTITDIVYLIKSDLFTQLITQPSNLTWMTIILITVIVLYITIININGVILRCAKAHIHQA